MTNRIASSKVEKRSFTGKEEGGGGGKQ